ncbi:MAG TPA: hypothetical protein VN371_10180 [Chlorobaculum sp.]|nr:hypothetical protein [Chlorobaculum sp.]
MFTIWVSSGILSRFYRDEYTDNGTKVVVFPFLQEKNIDLSATEQLLPGYADGSASVYRPKFEKSRID